MWIVEAILESVYTAYEQLPGGREPLPRDERGRIPLGSKHKFRNAPYRVVWILQTGNFSPPTQAASAPPADASSPPEQPTPHYQALCRFWCWIWECDQEAAWNVMEDLLAALRATVYGPNLGPQNFTYPAELDGKEIEDGALCVLDVTISVPMKRDGTVPVEEVAIGDLTTDVKLRNDLLGLETDPVPGADIEFVIVTDP